jgi:exonuclease III
MQMELQQTDPGFDPTRTDSRGHERTLAMKKYGQSGGIRSHASDTTQGRSANGKVYTVASYNVRTLADTKRESGPVIRHKLEQIIAGCEKNNIDILAMQEHRRISSNPIESVMIGDWTFAHTNSSQEWHGVAILYSMPIKNLVLTVEYKSDRIIATHLKGNPRACVVSAYAPTETSTQMSKDKFYRDLQDLILSIPPHTVIILAGDFNARIGADFHESNKRIVGPNCYYANTNNNGQRLIELCESANLRPAHSHFNNRRSRMTTYESPTGEPHQIDHIMVSIKWWKSIKNFRAYNTIYIGSDHKVVSANFRLSLRATKKPPNGRCKFNWEKLADPNTKIAFNIAVENKFSALLEQQAPSASEIQQRADALDEALRHASLSVLGKKKKTTHAHWVTQNTLLILEKCNKAAKKFKKTRLEAHKAQWRLLQTEVSQCFDHDRQADLDNHLAALEIAYQRREIGTAWKIINELAGGNNRADPSKVLLLDGSLPKGTKELLIGWSNYYSTLLNNKSKYADKASHPAPSPPIKEIKTSNFTYVEITQAIKQLKRNKSPGPDYAMTAEVLKDGGEFLVHELLKICQLVYKECNAPSQWTSSLIIPLPKKGNLQLMTNYRGICLMSYAAKVYNLMILNRIRSAIDAKLRKNQAGFRTGRSCTQQIHILRRIMDGAHSQNIPLFITFVDFKKAFDSIDRPMMFAILRHYGIPEKIVSAIRVMYAESKCQVYLQGEVSEPFKVTTGVLQGDVLAPFLFIIVIDYITRESAGDFGYLTHKGNDQDKSGRQLRSTTRQPDYKVNDLNFADDVSLLENEAFKAQQQLDALQAKARTTGLEINVKKTEQMRLNQPEGAPAPNLVIDGEEIAIVEDFKYLGSYVKSTEHDIEVRIGLAWGAFAKLKTILRSPMTKLHRKIRIFQAACVSILLYGCESWILTNTLSDKLDTFATKCYRIMLDIRLSKDFHMTNDELYKRVGQIPISETIRERQLKFTGHCLRMAADEPAHRFIVYESKIKTSLRPGAPRRTYRQQISSYLHPGEKDIKLEADEMQRRAENRTAWNQFAVSRRKKPPDPSIVLDR